MEEDSQQSKIRVLGMVLYSKKHRKHSPKKVRDPKLEIEGNPATFFADSEIIPKYYPREITNSIRKTFRKAFLTSLGN